MLFSRKKERKRERDQRVKKQHKLSKTVKKGIKLQMGREIRRCLNKLKYSFVKAMVMDNNVLKKLL